MAAYVHDSQFFTRRTIVLFAIIGLHIFIAWALATGLARRAIELVAPPLQTEIVEEVQK
jgi:protein TonB